jgi:hypothetical protein
MGNAARTDESEVGRLVEAAIALAARKSALDRELRRLSSGSRLMRWRRSLRTGATIPSRPCVAVRPEAFLTRALPYGGTRSARAASREDVVSPFSVIGATYWCEMLRMLGLDDQAFAHEFEARRRNRWESERARYEQIGTLPLYLAREGKNRVEAYRRARQPIRAAISRNYFPDRHELSLHKVRWSHLYAVTCSAAPPDDEPYDPTWGKPRLLPFGEAVALLRAYGVEECRPVTLPGAVMTLRRIYRDLSNDITQDPSDRV